MNPHNNENNKTQVAASINKYFPVTKEELRVKRKTSASVLLCPPLFDHERTDANCQTGLSSLQ